MTLSAENHSNVVASRDAGAQHNSGANPVQRAANGSSGAGRLRPRSGIAHSSAAGASAGACTGFGFIAESLSDIGSEPTVIADSAGPHRFHRMFRTLRETNQLPMAAGIADQGLALVHQAVREGRAVTTHLPNGGHRLRADCYPLVGPSGAVHAVRLEASKSEGGCGPHLPLIPVEFDAERLARFGSPDGPMPTLFRSDTSWTLPALLEHVVWLDKRLDLIGLFDPFEPASRWCESLIVVDPVTQERHHMWMAARSVIGPQGVPIVRAVIADVTALVAAPDRDPLTEHLATRANRGHGSALMDLRTTLMHSFSCHDDPRLALWRHRNPQLHPDDLPAIMTAVADLAAGKTTTITMRIRFTGNDPWTTLHATSSPLMNYARPQASIDFWIEN
ncbi:GAF domain-containing protein [Nocardia wallacei]|uniref:GAF domain-containing protein n=1 Tax=Nocardia wallacei TaxID=480035 RepID=UPI002457CB65|nr:GAF domain-containing protein [Nocardia wallacei]